MSIKFRPLKAEEVEVRVGTCNENGCSLLLYKDSRVDMKLLDEVVGPENWDCSYESIDGKLFCTVGIRCGKEGSYVEWVYKQDTGTPSNMEAQKGEASDAFKRACFKWGIGRELYTSPFVWVGSDSCNIKQGRNGKPQCYDDFRVTELEVDDGQIVKLVICNMSRKGQVVYGSKQATPKKQGAPKSGRFDKVRELKEKAISLGVKEEGIESWITATFKGKPKKDMSDSEIKMTEAYLAGLIRDMAELEAIASEGMNPNA